MVGVLLNDTIKSIFNNTKTVGISLLITAILLFLSKYPKIKNKKLTFKNAYIIGIAQGLAILPGVSRSGATISAGLMQGIGKQEAVKFSFLLFIPAIFGATLFEIRNISEISNITALLAGTITAIVTGFLSLKIPC